MKKSHRKITTDATSAEMGIPLIAPTSSQTIAKPNVSRSASAVELLLHLVVKNNGNVQLPKIIFPNSWCIDYVRGVYFNEEFDIEENDEHSLKWNAYVQRIRTAIGVHCYCEWVRDKDRNIIGILAFYNLKGEEIKVKHFNRWFDLLRCVQQHFC